MKVIRKTYAVRGLVEWKASIPVGRGKLIIHFTGGAFTAYGVTPAEYKTDNPAIQAIIENSAYFRNGRITLEGGIPVGDVPDTARTAGAVPSPDGTAHAAAVNTDNAPAVEDEVKSGQAEDATPAQEAGESAADDGPSLENMEVSCFEDARQHLMENYGYTSSAVRTKASVRKLAAANGIRFFIDGEEL